MAGVRRFGPIALSACLATGSSAFAADEHVPLIAAFETAVHPPHTIGRPAARSPGLPLIVAYETAKAVREARLAVLDPRQAWVRRVAKAIDVEVRQAAGLGATGVATVSFTVGRDGRILRRSVAQTSGNAALDRQALALVDKAGPFPGMPAELGGETMSFALPLRFR